METFLPSLNLQKPPEDSKSDHSLNQTAVWRHSNEHSIDEAEREERCTTFTMTRVMKKQDFDRKKPVADATQIANYYPETIEINVGVGRGKDVASLATASIVVTGDEESEVILSVPVKAVINKKKGLRRRMRGKQKKASAPEATFAADPLCSYSLEENAILKVGIKSTPQVNQDSYSITGGSKKGTLDHILEELEDSLLLEINDENSLLSELLRTPHSLESHHSSTVCTKSTQSVQPMQPVTKPSMFGSFLCGAIPGFTCEQGVPQTIEEKPEEEEEEEEEEGDEETRHTPVKKTAAAVVLPLSLMSSVSESTFGTFANSVAPSYRGHITAEV